MLISIVRKSDGKVVFEKDIKFTASALEKMLSFPLLIAGYAAGFAVGGPVGIVIGAVCAGIALTTTLVSLARAIRANSWPADNKKFPATPPAPLTAGEAALAKSIFGETLDVSPLRKSFSAAEKGIGRSRVAAQVFGGNNIKFYSAIPQQDFSDGTRVTDTCVFMHELTHAWQRQHESFLRRIFNAVTKTNRYSYKLLENSRFTKFGKEQQASLVEDYMSEILKSTPLRLGGISHYYPSNPRHADDLQKTAWLLRVVEEQFPQARETRLRQEAEALADPKIKAAIAETKAQIQRPALS